MLCRAHPIAKLVKTGLAIALALICAIANFESLFIVSLPWYLDTTASLASNPICFVFDDGVG